MTRPIRKGNKRPSRELDRALGLRIRAYREAQGLTQSDLAAKVGVTFQQQQKYERGESQVSSSRLVMVAEALELEPGKLIEEARAALGRTKCGPPGDKTQLELQRAAQKVTPAGRRALLAVAKVMGEEGR